MEREAFEAIAADICTPATDDERITLYLSGEQSDFVRLNHTLIRQATTVRQQTIELSVIRGRRKVSSRLTVPADPSAAITMLRPECSRLRDMTALIPEDPHLSLSDTVISSERQDNASGLPDTADVIDTLRQSAGDEELVGFFANGPMVRAFADSRGQRNWHQVASFHLDWSLFSRHADTRGQAVKSTLAGRQFDPLALRARMDAAREHLALLEKPAKALAPGSYRAWLAPGAVSELLQTMAWSGFSRKEHASGTSSLGLLHQPTTRLHPGLQISETIGGGIAPAFTLDGRALPGQLDLIHTGHLNAQLTSARSATEFSETCNANDSEYPTALTMGAGSITQAQALSELGTGLWIGNLWYLNYSDRQAARVTGMTRFACFYVCNGRIEAPVGVMRFDDSLLHLFGDRLEGMSTEVEFLPGSSTWNERELNSVSCPAMLLSGLTLTL